MDQGLRRMGGMGVFCHENHWKHPLLRTRDGLWVVAQSRGSHIPFVPQEHGRPKYAMLEPGEPIMMFHAPMRAKEATFNRLKALCGEPTETGHRRSAGDEHHIQGQGAIKRWRCL
jgi:hypothetical protein